MDKAVLDRRLDLLSAEGITFECDRDCGVDVSGRDRLERHDAVVLALGSERAREADLPGRHLDGIHLAMEYLMGQNRRVAGQTVEVVSARGRSVSIIGGGDTAADCLGDSHREECASVQQLVIYPEPPRTRTASNPWPQWPLVLRSHAANEAGHVRRASRPARRGDRLTHARGGGASLSAWASAGSSTTPPPSPSPIAAAARTSPRTPCRPSRRRSRSAIATSRRTRI